MQRATRAQRAAYGGTPKPLVSVKREPTMAQNDRIKKLRADFGRAVKSVRTPDALTGHVTVALQAYSGLVYWVFDMAGEFVSQYRSTRPLWSERDATE